MASLWSEMSANRRVTVLSMGAVLLVMGYFGVQRFSVPDYVPLFHELDLAEAGNITDRLTKATISFKLAAGGADILVPEKDAARARVLLAKDGLPANGRPGLELFDKPSWGMTDFTQRITYRRALEGELARTIGTLRGVQRAQVHLSLPEASPLRRLDQPAEGAVVVSLRAGESLSAEQVRGIAQLVSSSVERLPVDHVTVLDDSGRPLTNAAGDETGLSLSTHQLELQASVEKHLANKATEILSAAVGAGAARVQVDARLNFDQVDKTTEAYDTAGRVLSNEQRSTPTGDSIGSSAGQEILNNSYLNSRKIEKLVGTVGNITKLNVAVMVNSKALGDDAAAADTKRAQLETLVRQAVGIDSTRGDRLSVVAVPFDVPVAPPVVPPEVVKTSPVEVVREFAFPLVGLIALIAAIVLGWMALRPQKGRAGGPQGQLAMTATQGEFPTLGGNTGRVELRDRVQAESLSAPEAAARVIRAWLTEQA